MENNATEDQGAPDAELFLKVVHGDDKGKGWELHVDGRYTIGRSHRCQLRLSDESVSGRHAKLSAEHGIWFITDLRSSHGTRLNNDRILDKTPVFDRDLIRLGKTVLEFREYETLDPEDLAEIDRGVELPE